MHLSRFNAENLKFDFINSGFVAEIILLVTSNIKIEAKMGINKKLGSIGCEAVWVVKSVVIQYRVGVKNIAGLMIAIAFMPRSM